MYTLMCIKLLTNKNLLYKKSNNKKITRILIGIESIDEFEGTDISKTLSLLIHDCGISLPLFRSSLISLSREKFYSFHCTNLIPLLSNLYLSI